MKKSIALLSTIAVLFTSTAFAQAPQKQHPKHNPEFHKAIGECLAQAGIKKPELPQEFKDKADKKAWKKETDGHQFPKEFKGKHDKHPKLEMSDAQRTQVDSCLKQKGFEKPTKKLHHKTTDQKPAQ